MLNVVQVGPMVDRPGLMVFQGKVGVVVVAVVLLDGATTVPGRRSHSLRRNERQQEVDMLTTLVGASLKKRRLCRPLMMESRLSKYTKRTGRVRSYIPAGLYEAREDV